ncbi:glycine betaine uptake BCCT transporter [Caminicella sporogenes]|uniref:glycine betaine uptake BCCT transporter n=1 Tax=Caminicella sporogenes TaxID=166485 RepID=UPI00253F79B5|nr:BCCT family transporter [Caminicella sporogenes]WIF94054.1 BCCT family transporter [Caminicella sporogenes]
MTKKKDNIVYYISLLIVFAIVIWGILFKNSFSIAANGLFKFLTNNFGWSYLLAMFIFVCFALILAFSKYGNIKLGPDDSKPDYSTTSWFAMLFGAGMGIGLVFWGVAEPLSHFISPPGLEPGSSEAANFAMRVSFAHWGFHPWANYSIIGLALAYFQFRKNKPGLISSIFIPLIGEKGVNGIIGKLIDIFAVFATVAGVATSLGLGTLQINSGLNYLFKIPETQLVQIIIIIIITIIYIWTAVSGIEKGIKLLSDINLLAAIAILLGSFLIGPTVKMINALINGMGMYMGSFVRESLHIEPFGDNSWINGWTIFYWAWWIAWAPFVGTFIARISRGRTIREFIIGVIVAPSLASFVWFAVFGVLGIDLINTTDLSILEGLAKNPATTLFGVLKYYPLGSIVSLIAVFLLCTFFITSANSATFVLGMFTSEGNLNPSSRKKIIWGIVQSLLATALLLAGGLKTLQIGSIAAAFPFIFVMIFACISLFKALKEDTEKVSNEN